MKICGVLSAVFATALAVPIAAFAQQKYPVKSVKDLVALAKKHPDEINCASGGIGSAQHIPMALLEAMTGIKLVHVAYKGITPAFNDVVAGQVPIAFTGLFEVVGSSPDAFAALIKNDTARLGKVIRDAGIRAE